MLNKKESMAYICTLLRSKSGKKLVSKKLLAYFSVFNTSDVTQDGHEFTV